MTHVYPVCMLSCISNAVKTKETAEKLVETTNQHTAEPQGAEPTEATPSKTPPEETASGVCVCVALSNKSWRDAEWSQILIHWCPSRSNFIITI